MYMVYRRLFVCLFGLLVLALPIFVPTELAHAKPSIPVTPKITITPRLATPTPTATATPKPTAMATPTLTPTPIPTQSYYFGRAYVSFPKNQLNALWVITRLDYNDQLQVIGYSDILTKDISQNCPLVQPTRGSITIENERANFNGGYIHCTLPDFKTELFNSLNVKQEIKCLCNINQLAPPWFAARLGGVQFGVKTLPVVTSSDWLWQLQFQSSNTAYTQLLREQWSGPGNSNVFDLNPDKGTVAFSGYNAFTYLQVADFQGRDRFMADPNFQAAAADSPTDKFLAWVQGAQAVNQAIPTNSINSLTTTDLYIGYNGQDYFRGWISNVLVDPGCSGAK
jgi:hypothetical protein